MSNVPSFLSNDRQIDYQRYTHTCGREEEAQGGIKTGVGGVWLNSMICATYLANDLYT